MINGVIECAVGLDFCALSVAKKVHKLHKAPQSGLQRNDMEYIPGWWLSHPSEKYESQLG